MKRSGTAQTVVRALLSVGLVALLVGAGLPHHHDGTVASHPAHACRLCKLQDGFSATPPASPVHLAPSLFILGARLAFHQTPRALAVVRLPDPRAPPLAS